MRELREGFEWLVKVRDHLEVENCNWDSLLGHDWTNLLITNPEFEDKCQWEKLDEEDWLILVGQCPEVCRGDPRQLLAVYKSPVIFKLLIEPSERVRRLHEMKWKL